jgi:hypothetical protein
MLPAPFTLEPPGFIRVQYDRPEQLVPEAQGLLVSTLVRSGKAGPVNLLFVLARAVWTVDPAVPAFWLNATADKTVQLQKMAIVSPSTAVRTAAIGFSVANALRGRKFQTQAFTSENEARAWLSKPA